MTAPIFAEEVRTEILTMFTGMVLQGLVAGHSHRQVAYSTRAVAREAVELADAAVTALEEHHASRRDELIAQRKQGA